MEMLSTLSDAQRTELNVFLSNFSELNFPNFKRGSFDTVTLVNFAYMHNKINPFGRDRIDVRQYGGESCYSISAADVDACLNRFLGVQIDQERPDYVLIAFDTELDYKKMTMLCDHVRAGLPYIATHPDFNCPTETGFIPDIGATIAYVKASTGREPDVIIGKPNSGIVEETLRVTGLKKEEMAMVGDRLYTDIATGVNFGMLSILVMSGETTAQMAAESPIKPGLTFGRLAEMIPYL